MVGILIAGGRAQDVWISSILNAYEKTEQWLIAIDGGLAVLKRLNRIPQEIVGDFDTVDTKILSYYREIPGIIWETHKPEKDATDTELALEAAKKAGCSHVILLGATGGRLDHELSNIQLLNLYTDAEMSMEILDEKNRITLLRADSPSGMLSLAGKRTFEKEMVYGKYVSFVPMSEEVKGITLTGFKYPLIKKDITIGSSLCISNEVVCKTAEITFDKGILLCIESRD